MKIIGKNAAVAQTAEDVITAGGVHVMPTTERVHAIASTSAEDSDGVLQQETATAAGTIDGILQVETQTIVGTIEAAGAGDINVVVTGAFVAGSPLTIAVAVANNDTASQVAGKVRTALGIAAITDNYTVGGTSASFKLTTKVKAANDATLKLAYDNGTAAGLTPATTSTHTTAGHAGTGNASVTVTSAIVTGSPLTIAVPVVTGDTASAWAAKVRTALNNTAAITSKYTVSGATTAIILTAKTKAANDTTLNIATDNGTCNGITTAGTSVDTVAGFEGSGAHAVIVTGVDLLGKSKSETVVLNGQTPVNTVQSYLYINSLEVKHAGSGLKNAGVITATAATDGTVTSQIEIGKNKAQYGIFLAPALTSIKNFFVSAYNATGGAVTTVDILTKRAGDVWLPAFTLELSSNMPSFSDKGGSFIGSIAKSNFFKISAVASAGSSNVMCAFETV